MFTKRIYRRLVLPLSTTASLTAAPSLETHRGGRASIIGGLKERWCPCATNPGARHITVSCCGSSVEGTIDTADSPHLNRIQRIGIGRLARDLNDRRNAARPRCSCTRYRGREIKGVATTCLSAAETPALIPLTGTAVAPETVAPTRTLEPSSIVPSARTAEAPHPITLPRPTTHTGETKARGGIGNLSKALGSHTR